MGRDMAGSPRFIQVNVHSKREWAHVLSHGRGTGPGRYTKCTRLSTQCMVAPLPLQPGRRSRDDRPQVDNRPFFRPLVRTGMPPRHDPPSRHAVDAVLNAGLAAQRGGSLPGWTQRYPRLTKWLRERWLAPLIDGL